MKDSGIGRELGPEALNNYLEYQSIYAQRRPPARLSALTP